MNEYFVKVKLYHGGRSLGTKYFILDAENGKEAIRLVEEHIQKKQNSNFLIHSEISDDFELLDIHRL